MNGQGAVRESAEITHSADTAVSDQIEAILKDVEGTANVSLGSLTPALSGTTATELTAFSSTDTYDLDAILSEEDMTTINDLRSLPIQTSSGAYVRLIQSRSFPKASPR